MIVEHSARVSHLHFSPVFPFDLAVTASNKVTLYDMAQVTVRKTLSRFRDSAYSDYRSDGKLLVAGSEDHRVQVHFLLSCFPSFVVALSLLFSR